MANFPSSIPSYAGFTSTDTLSQDNHAAQHNAEQGDVTAIATKIGTGASTPTSGVVLRGNGTGTSTWDTLHLAADVQGILGTANGGTGTASTTGSGSAVFQTSPTLITPTIADFSNAQHNHQGATGGGTLNAASALQAGSVSFANLLSTIFGGQVATQANSGTWGGTMSYVNLGGIKLLWIVTDAQTSGTSANAYTVTLPTSFFSTITAVQANAMNMTVDGRQYASVNSATTTTLTITITDTAGAGTSAVSVLVIGT